MCKLKMIQAKTSLLISRLKVIYGNDYVLSCHSLDCLKEIKNAWEMPLILPNYSGLYNCLFLLAQAFLTGGRETFGKNPNQ